MATAFQSPLDFPRHKLWTRSECALLQGVMDLQRYELIEGELLEKVSKSHPHMLVAQALLNWLLGVFDGALVAAEPSIDVRPEDNPTSEPEPDVVVLNRSLRELAPRPRPADISLAVEISDATLEFDLGRKRDLYARAGIADYWVIDVCDRRVVVHRGPAAGRYQSIQAYGEDEQIAPLVKSASRIFVRDLF